MKDWCCVLFLSLKLDFCVPENESPRGFRPKAKKEDPTHNLDRLLWKKNRIISQFHTSEPSSFNQQVREISSCIFQNIFTGLQTPSGMKENQFHDVLLPLKFCFEVYYNLIGEM